jgi:hypothetical protein
MMIARSLPRTPVDAYACPRCGDLVGTVGRRSWGSVGRAAAVFAALLFLWLVLRSSPFSALMTHVAAAAAIAALAVTVLCAVTAPFARNRCRNCGHRWR